MIDRIQNGVDTDSSPVVFIQHTARRKVGGQGMMGRAKGRRRLGNPVFKMAVELMADGGDMVNLENRPFHCAYLSHK